MPFHLVQGHCSVQAVFRARKLLGILCSTILRFIEYDSVPACGTAVCACVSKEFGPSVGQAEARDTLLRLTLPAKLSGFEPSDPSEIWTTSAHLSRC
jgi:hypothetical protein